MSIQFRFLDAHYQTLRQLFADPAREQCCFLVCGTAQGDGNETLLLVREVLPLSAQDFRVHAFDQISVDPAAMLRVARRAQALGGAICMVHTHPMSSGEVEFSTADDHGNVETFRFFSRMLPGKPNSCLVFDRNLDCVQGRVYTSATAWEPISNVVLVSGGRRLVLLPHLGRVVGTEQIEERFDRQARLLGAEGQRQLSRIRIGIIGCGGIGSLVAINAVHSGVADFVLVDYDTIGASNLPRIVGSAPTDVGAPKVKISERYLKLHCPNATIRTFQAPVEAPELRPVLASLDIVVCGTDDTTSRAYLNQLCHQFYVPILDLGVQFSADPVTGELVKEVGRANLMLPGTTCLGCTGQVNPDRLRAEGLPTQERDKLVQEGYVEGVEVTEPSMMVFNAQVAARGMQHLIAWVTGLRAIPQDEFENFRFFGLTAEAGVKQVRKRPVLDCLICGPESKVAGQGDNLSMFVGPRPLDRDST